MCTQCMEHCKESGLKHVPFQSQNTLQERKATWKDPGG